ncbi:hypothetical protein D3C76_1477270 [compost metagenome]
MYPPVLKTIPHARTIITTVLIAVAKLESTPLIPILARIDVSAANTAESMANNFHILYPPYKNHYFFTLAYSDLINSLQN